MKDKKKTILITISKDIIRRNIFDTEFWPELVKRARGARIALLVEEEKVEYAKEHFPEAFLVRGYERESYHGYNKFLMFLVRTGIRSHSTTTYRLRAYKRGSVGLSVTLVKSIISQTFGRTRWYKNFVRFLITKMYIAEAIRAVYDEVKPDIVFTPSLIDTDFDVPVAVEARKRSIRTLGMVRSWDNLNNHGVLAFIPDRFIVQNVWLKEAAEHFQGISKESITDIVGLPHYDLYKEPSQFIKSRDEFFAQYGLDPKKKLILLGGSDFYYSEDRLPTTFNDLIESGRIKIPAQIMFRPHPASIFDIDDYNLSRLNHVVLDRTFVDKGAVNFSNEEQFVNLMVHSDIVVNIASTLSIDASVFDTPAICINFDTPEKKLSKWESVHRLYDTFDHYERLVSTGGVRLPRSSQELAEDINDYLNDPELDRTGRQSILAAFVEPFDGRAGKRLAGIISEEIEKGVSVANA